MKPGLPRAALPSTLLLIGVASCGERPPAPLRPAAIVALPDAGARDGASVSGEDPKAMTRRSSLVETLHGAPVADPYRWLEDGDSPEVKAWTAAQNGRTRRVVDGIAGRDRLKAEIDALLRVGTVSAPVARRTKTGIRYFHTKREGGQDQPRLLVRDGHGGADRVLIDVAALSPDGTTALDWWFPSNDGRLVAWGRSESGSEDSVLYVRDVATGKDLPERIDRTRFASVAWMPDGKRFYYSRYPAPGTVPAGEERYHARIYLHELGTDPASDPLVFGEGLEKTDIPAVLLSPNGRWLVALVHMGWDRSDVYLKDLSKPSSTFTPVAVGVHAVFDPEPEDGRLWLRTNEGASRYRLFSVDYARPAREAWREVLPEGKDVLEDVALLEDEIVATYMHDASSRLERFSRQGKPRGTFELPTMGTASTRRVRGTDELFVRFSSFVVPPEVHRVELRKGARLVPWDRAAGLPASEAADVEVTQLFATSKDGTRVPMFVIAKKGLGRDGQRPTILSGYGGFNINETPAFRERTLAAVRHGAVWVSAVLRGGGEYGEAWHEAGMLGNKQNVFDDLQACAEQLFAEKITSPAHLAVTGGSNGGLLVAAAVTQHPETYRVGLSRVPLTDMLRYHHFRIAKLWIPEYGDPEKPEHFAFLRAYSPYHHVRAGTRYPSMMFTTAESDTRVDPMHARKMAAAMQEAQADPTRPILLRVETKAGHGAGKPASKLADELTDELAFVLNELGVAL